MRKTLAKNLFIFFHFAIDKYASFLYYVNNSNGLPPYEFTLQVQIKIYSNRSPEPPQEWIYKCNYEKTYFSDKSFYFSSPTPSVHFTPSPVP